ncbi:hypothetical protein CRYUN_Cryun24cG0115100 [Craigia yunnanensis]
MATTSENVIAKDEMAKEKVNSENGMKAAEDKTNGKVHEEETVGGEVTKEEAKKQEVAVEVEPKTGVSFPVKLDDWKQLNRVGLRKKSMLGMGIKIYGFGMYIDNEKLKDLLKSEIGIAPEKPRSSIRTHFKLLVSLDDRVMGQASDDIKLTPGSLIEISRLPGYVLQTTVMGEVVTKEESELLCRAYTHMYLGDDALDKDAKDKFDA